MRTRASVELDRMWKRRGLRKTFRGKQLKGMRSNLYSKMDRQLDRMRHGLKELIADTIHLKNIKSKTMPESPMQRYK